MQQSSCFLFLEPAPLLEEERHLIPPTISFHSENPFFEHGPSTRSRLTANDDPVNVPQVERRHVFQKRFHGEEPHCHLRLPKMFDPRHAVFTILDRHAPPDVTVHRRKCELAVEHVSHPFRPLRQHLVGMPAGTDHDPDDGLDEIIGDIFVKQVAHRVHEDHLGGQPSQGIGKMIWHKPQIEPLFVGMALHTPESFGERHDIGDVYVWYGIDQDTKLAPSFIVGKRSADNARKLMVDLAGRLIFPTPTQSDARNYNAGGFQRITQISTDGFPGYSEAVDLAFGPYAKFGTIVKDYRNANLPYHPSEMVGTQRRGIFGINPDEVRSICTSHVERANLTMRTLLKRFTRLSLGFSKKLANLEAAVAVYFAYYNFVWRTRHTDESGQSGRLRPTAAMMAGVTDTLWSFEDLFDAVMA